MPRVVLMCGPAGSGKSTAARRLEQQGYVRLSFDTEIWRRGLTSPLEPEVHAEIEAELQRELLRLVTSGADVVLDFSFWSRQMRDRYREMLAPVVPETWYLETDRATALRRVRERTGAHADDVVLSPSWPRATTTTSRSPRPRRGRCDGSQAARARLDRH